MISRKAVQTKYVEVEVEYTFYRSWPETPPFPWTKFGYCQDVKWCSFKDGLIEWTEDELMNHQWMPEPYIIKQGSTS